MLINKVISSVKNEIMVKRTLIDFRLIYIIANTIYMNTQITISSN